MLRGVLLDVDGTLIDSNDAHAHAWVLALGECGVDVQFTEVRPLIGMGGDKLLPMVAGIQEDSEKGKQISRLRGKIFESRYLPALQAFPGARALLEGMHASGLKLAAASSATKKELKSLLDICLAEDL